MTPVEEEWRERERECPQPHESLRFAPYIATTRRVTKRSTGPCQSRRKLSGANPEQAMWLKYVDPEETEGEHYTVYERGLERFDGDLLRAA